MVKVQPGSPWRVPAAAQQNAWDAAAEDYQRRERSGGGGDRRGPILSGVLRVKNVSGADRRRYEVLSLDGDLALDAVDRENMWLEATVAAAPQRLFVVLLEPIKSNNIGPAQINGICPALVNVTNDAHRRATLIASEDRFTSNLTGPVQILYLPSGTGEKTCIVNLSNRAAVKLYGFTPAGGIAAATKSSDTISPGSASCDVWYYDHATSDYVPLEDSGTTQVTETVYNPFPTAITGTRWISFSEDDDGLITIDAEACEAFA